MDTVKFKVLPKRILAIHFFKYY